MTLGSKQTISPKNISRVGFKDGSNRAYVEGAAIVDLDGNAIAPALITPAKDLEGGGDTTIGTSEVEIAFSGTPTREIRIRADVDNTGIIFIGKTGVLSDKTNDYVRLEAGDEVTVHYDDASNALYAISDTSAQKINTGALL